MNLLEKKCVPCEGGTPSMSREEAEKYLPRVSDWKLSDDAKTISKTFTRKDFREAMVFVNKVADLAEEEGHHPDIHISWNTVRLSLTTHAIKGLSENDFILAAKINALI